MSFLNTTVLCMQLAQCSQSALREAQHCQQNTRRAGARYRTPGWTNRMACSGHTRSLQVTVSECGQLQTTGGVLGSLSQARLADFRPPLPLLQNGDDDDASNTPSTHVVYY